MGVVIATQTFGIRVYRCFKASVAVMGAVRAMKTFRIRVCRSISVAQLVWRGLVQDPLVEAGCLGGLAFFNIAMVFLRRSSYVYRTCNANI